MLEIFSVTVSICWFRTLQQTTILLSLIWWNSLFHHIFIALYNTITINFFWSAFKFSYFYPLLWSDNNHQSLSLSWSIRFLDISKILIRYVVGYFLHKFIFYLFIYFWLCWVFISVQGLSLVAASRGHSSSQCVGLSLSRPLLLRSTSSRRAGSVVVAHGLSCSAACGIFPDQGSNPCPLHWQADYQPLRHQGGPISLFLKWIIIRRFPYYMLSITWSLMLLSLTLCCY